MMNIEGNVNFLVPHQKEATISAKSSALGLADLVGKPMKYNNLMGIGHQRKMPLRGGSVHRTMENIS